MSTKSFILSSNNFLRGGGQSVNQSHIFQQKLHLLLCLITTSRKCEAGSKSCLDYLPWCWLLVSGQLSIPTALFQSTQFAASKPGLILCYSGSENFISGPEWLPSFRIFRKFLLSYSTSKHSNRKFNYATAVSVHMASNLSSRPQFYSTHFKLMTASFKK